MDSDDDVAMNTVHVAKKKPEAKKLDAGDEKCQMHKTTRHGKKEPKKKKSDSKAKKKGKKGKKDKKDKKDEKDKKDKLDRKPAEDAKGKKKADTPTKARIDDASFARQVTKRARRAQSPEAQPDPAPGSSIKVGSDCTGYGSESIALSLLGVDSTFVFVAEKEAGKRELLRAAHRNMDFSKVIVYHDITKRNHAEAPYVDCFFTGAPCQPWSQAGKQLGLEDDKHRGVVLFHSIDYITCQRPRVVVIENVKGLTCGKNKKILDDILCALKDLGYTVEWKVMNTKDHGIPHSRPRLYIIGIRTRFLAKSIAFPKRLHRSAPLSSFIDVDDQRSTDECPNSKSFKQAMAKAANKHTQKKMEESLVVVDVGSSEKYSNSMIGCVPCITKSRGRPVMNNYLNSTYIFSRNPAHRQDGTLD